MNSFSIILFAQNRVQTIHFLAHTPYFSDQLDLALFENLKNQKICIKKHCEVIWWNVHDKGAIEITESSYRRSNEEEGKFAADLGNKSSIFFSQNEKNSWIQYNFKEKKIKPTHYSIRTTHYKGKGLSRPLNWIIKGSNTRKDDWTTLDRRNNVTELDGESIVRTFELQENIKSNEYYQYIRLKQIGKTSGNTYNLVLSALGFFGYVK